MNDKNRWKFDKQEQEMSRVYNPDTKLDIAIMEAKHHLKKQEMLATRHISFEIGTRFLYSNRLYEIIEKYPASSIATYHLFREAV